MTHDGWLNMGKTSLENREGEVRRGGERAKFNFSPPGGREKEEVEVMGRDILTETTFLSCLAPADVDCEVGGGGDLSRGTENDTFRERKRGEKEEVVNDFSPSLLSKITVDLFLSLSVFWR